MIQTIVERIYIVDKDDERFCHIFIKGCTDEDYTGFFQTAGYIEQKTTPVCDSEQYCIFNVFSGGAHTSVSRFRTKSITVADTISATVIFYFPLFCRRFLSENGGFSEHFCR